MGYFLLGLIVSIGVAGLILLFLWLLDDTGSKQGNDQAVANNANEGVSDMFVKKEKDGTSQMRDVINQVMDEAGLTKIIIESPKQVFEQMPAGLRAQMEDHLGPIFKDEAAGFVSQRLELVGKVEEAWARTAYAQIQSAIRHHHQDVEGKITLLDMKQALDKADALAEIAAEHGEEEADNLRRVLRRLSIHLVSERFLSSLAGVNVPEALQAVKKTVPLLPDANSDKDIDEKIEIDINDEPIEGQFEDIRYRDNGS